jgi:hypothetical protein
MSDIEFLGTERIPSRRAQPDGPSDLHPIHALQNTIGNAAVARMLQREAAPEEEEEEIQAKHDPSAAQPLRREAAPEEEEEEIQAKHDPGLAQRAPEVGLAGGAVSDGLAGRIDAQRGGGSPLDDSTRSTMESTLGAPLDGVRVHVGNESDQLNHAITAKAFTTGSDVFVRSDQWAPGSSSTQRLLAHELTHVVQQQSMPGAAAGMNVGAADTAEEREADDVAHQVMSRSADASVHRSADEADEDAGG